MSPTCVNLLKEVAWHFYNRKMDGDLKILIILFWLFLQVNIKYKSIVFFLENNFIFEIDLRV